MESVEAIVIGAGVVGLAIARQLALMGREVIVLEAEDSVGTHSSSRNSEVIHAGIYYPTDSLKALFCVRGKKRLYAFCKNHGVECKRVGKLIIANSENEITQLKKLQARAAKNGVDDLQFLSSKELQKKEPELFAVAGLFSPSTGIIDSHALLLALQGDGEKKGVSYVFNSKVISGKRRENGITLSIEQKQSEPFVVQAQMVFNAAGLMASYVANCIEPMPRDKIPATNFCKGNYFSLIGPSPFKHLVYPVPSKAGLGVHSTLDLNNKTRFGPDVQWIPEIDYQVDVAQLDAFHRAISCYWPDILNRELQPDYTGIRPKLVDAGGGFFDFKIQGPEQHGVPGLVNLYGIESPGLTACLEIASYCVDMIYKPYEDAQ